MGKKISIIMPVYNTERYLKKSIDSVLKQEYKDCELILVNDGSTDSSSSICDYYARTNSKVRYYETDNHGVAGARNFGIDHADGDYIGFVDSDDVIEPDMYKKLYESISEECADISACAYDKIGIGGRILYKSKYYKDEAKVVIENPKTNMAYIFGYGTDILPNKLFRSEIFNKLRLTNDTTYEDIMVMPTLIKASKKIVHINDVLYHYQLRNDNITSDDSWNGVSAFLKAKKERFSLSKDEGVVIPIITAISLLNSVLDWMEYTDKHLEFFYNLLADMSSYFPCLQDDQANKITKLFRNMERERR